ncbi:hypothetical protein BC938DRAFT_482077 [Jimgerdemannia flammicorona]|uniref:Uncharacterized protein n=1 Tax=Jimgerdemannia flammicorona TaxID=994334 RepID=A0A433QWJ2_9FUNG|nr:hypothetical protein BC938DRAFT_482077 [Jimgerdemannia flammicorona]
MGNPIEFENSLLNAFEDDVFRSWWTKVEPYVSGNARVVNGHHKLGDLAIHLVNRIALKIS